MDTSQRFRVVMPGGLTSLDTFILVDPQPERIKAGCVLAAHEPSGRQITVHSTRLLPAETPGESEHRICLECGKVEGVVEDEVLCPHGENGLCGLTAAYGDSG